MAKFIEITPLETYGKPMKSHFLNVDKIYAVKESGDHAFIALDPNGGITCQESMTTIMNRIWEKDK